MAYRLFDIFNAKVATTQVVGAQSFEVTEGRDVVASRGDGFAGEAARDRTHYFASGRLEGQDISGLGTLIALWEGADSNAVLAEGRLAGDADKSARLTLQRTKLVAASLSFQQGQHARTVLEVQNSAAAASNTEDDECSLVEVTRKTITHAARYRGVRIKAVSFTPDSGTEIPPLAIKGLDWSVRYDAVADVGDDEFGKVVETSGGVVTGRIVFADLTIDTLRTVKQRLLAAKWGSLDITYEQQGGQADKTLTLANLQFESGPTRLGASAFASNELAFGQFWQNGANAYSIGTGTYKLYSVA